MKETRKAKEIRAMTDDDGKQKKIVGYAAVFDKPSEDMGFIETIRKGAFGDALKISDARALFNHDTCTLPLGRQSAGTLTLSEDDTGLRFEIIPPDTQSARDLMTCIDRGDIKEASYGFTVDVDEWDYSNKDVIKRTIIKVREIFDISPVVFAAFNDTSVALRRLEEKRSAAVPPGGNGGTDDPAIITGLMRKKLESKTILFGGA
jgi:HK97 family phage prohead protease